MITGFKKGGIHPPENKLSGTSAIVTAKLPDEVVMLLNQHIGAPAKAIVAKGDKVVTGEVIAEATGFISARLHSPITGEVTAISERPDGQGVPQMSITIKRSEEEQWAEGINTSNRIVRKCELKPTEIIEKIAAAGVVGMGGAAFPTHAKLTIPKEKEAKHLIINGAECEPYLTADHRVMLERSEEILLGVQLLMRALALQSAQIGIEENKLDAIERLRALAKSYEGIAIVPLKVNYPQGAEKQIVDALLGIEIPGPPALPIDQGVVVCNVSTAVAVYEAVNKSKPLIERVVTITGKSFPRAKNLKVRIGTSISSLIEMMGGLPEDSAKLINGGPMMGRAMINIEAPITKGCSGITVMDTTEAQRGAESNCIKCARCINACPLNLEPYYISKVSKRCDWEKAERENIIDCCECGSCQYTCPANIPLLDYIKIGKRAVLDAKRVRAMEKLAEQSAQGGE